MENNTPENQSETPSVDSLTMHWVTRKTTTGNSSGWEVIAYVRANDAAAVERTLRAEIAHWHEVARGCQEESRAMDGLNDPETEVGKYRLALGESLIERAEMERQLRQANAEAESLRETRRQQMLKIADLDREGDQCLAASSEQFKRPWEQSRGRPILSSCRDR